MKTLIVGLGNPGAKYSRNRHNAGFLAVDFLCRHHRIRAFEKFKKSLIAKKEEEGRTLLFLKPQTYMNSSGEAVHKAAAFFRIPLSRLIVIHDEIDFPAGKAKIKKNGSSGGHNGVQSVMDALGSGNFIRIRIGINGPGRGAAPLDEYVLSDFTRDEAALTEKVLGRIPDMVGAIITKGVDRAMNEYNK